MHMKYCTIIILCFLISVASKGIAQEKQNEVQLINEQVWSKFYEAFSTLNYKLMAEIHHKNLIRISGNGKKISDYESYIEGYKNSFQQSNEKEENREIALRFFERFNNEDTASERGIYQLTINKGKEDERMFYGQFHVLHKKVDGVWKIFIDYDSNENNTIGKVAFDAAKSINEVKGW